MFSSFSLFHIHIKNRDVRLVSSHISSSLTLDRSPEISQHVPNNRPSIWLLRKLSAHRFFFSPSLTSSFMFSFHLCVFSSQFLCEHMCVNINPDWSAMPFWLRPTLNRAWLPSLFLNIAYLLQRFLCLLPSEWDSNKHPLSHTVAFIIRLLPLMWEITWG